MRLVVTPDRDEMAAVLDDVEIAAALVPGSLLVAAPRLRWFHAWGAGVDGVLQYPGAIEHDFILTSTSGIHPIQMTEHVLALMLAFARRLPDALRAQATRTWRHMEKAEVFELAGKTLLVVGLGAIGQRIAQVAAALGMRVLGVRRTPSGLPGTERVAGIESLHDLLPEADFVVLVTPLTPETRGLIGERELRLMKRDAYLINVARGGVVDEAALVRALREGWIAGAGLDVFAHEPLPPTRRCGTWRTLSSPATTPVLRRPTMTGRSRSFWTICAATARASRCAMWWTNAWGIEVKSASRAERSIG